MFKKILAGLLIFAGISVLCGQDLNYQLNSLNDRFNINIQENVKSTFTDTIQNILDMFIG